MSKKVQARKRPVSKEGPVEPQAEVEAPIEQEKRVKPKKRKAFAVLEVVVRVPGYVAEASVIVDESKLDAAERSTVLADLIDQLHNLQV